MGRSRLDDLGRHTDGRHDGVTNGGSERTERPARKGSTATAAKAAAEEAGNCA